jgi:glycosyltransferase involved in cell wall biosynthesis
MRENTEEKEKIIFISSMQPASNYSAYLCRALAKEDIELIVYAENDPRNLTVLDCGEIRLVWDKPLSYVYQIFRELLKDKPKKVHIQHEVNMYGGQVSALLFPVLLLLIKLTGADITTTIHAVVPVKGINKNFISMFTQKLVPPNVWLTKLVFHYIYRGTAFLSHKVIVHTNKIKKTLHNNYNVKEEKIHVIPHGVPTVEKNPHVPPGLDKYLLYFGYMVKRKGLDKVIKGYIKYLKKGGSKKYKLILAGGVIKGQEFAFEELKKIVKDSGHSDQITFTGFLSEEEISMYYSNAYVVLLPAAVSISASGPLAQSFAYGKCTLVTSMGNFKEEIADKKTGILVKNNNWRDAIEFSIKNPKLISEIEKNSLQKGKDRSWDKIAKMHKNIYDL